MKRVKLPSDYIFPVLNATLVTVEDADGERRIVWEYEGETYHQVAHADRSEFYIVCSE